MRGGEKSTMLWYCSPHSRRHMYERDDITGGQVVGWLVGIFPIVSFLPSVLL